MRLTEFYVYFDPLLKCVAYGRGVLLNNSGPNS